MNTVKPVYNELGYNDFPLINEAHRFHRSHTFLYELIGYNENLLLTKAFWTHRRIRYKRV